MTLREQLGASIRDLRRRRGLSLDDVQSETGLPAASLSRWETGAAKNGVPVDKLELLAKIYGYGVRIDLVRGLDGARVAVVENSSPKIVAALDELESLLAGADAATVDRVIFAARFAVTQSAAERKASSE